MYQFRRFAVLGALAVAGSMPTTAAAATCHGVDRVPTAETVGQARSATLCLLNRERSAKDLPTLRPEVRLARAALGHGRDMVANDYFAHDSRSGRSFDERIRGAGYLKGASRWTLGENLAWGSGRASTPRSIVKAWMASPPHRRNVLQRAFSEIGVAITPGAPVAVNGAAATYATDFGHRR